MKILYLVHQFYPEHYTGTEKIVLNLANMMQKLGNKVKVLTYSFYNNDFYDGNIGSILFKEFYFKGIPVIAFKLKDEPIDLHYSIRCDQLSQFAEKVLKEEKPDLVHAVHLMRVGEILLEASRKNIPYVITLTDSFMLCPKVILTTSKNSLCVGPREGANCKELCNELPVNLIKKRLSLSKEILKAAKKVYVPSRFLATIFKNEFTDLKFHVLPHGISLIKREKNNKKYKQDSSIEFCYAGSISYHKGVHLLIDAFKKLNNKNTKLVIYGSGTPNYVEKLKEKIKNDERVTFAGIYSENELGRILGKIDVVVIPSICYESYSLVLHEAFACNVPVIGSKVGSLGEKIKDEFNGYSFKVSDINELKDRMQYIVNNPQVLNELKNKINKEIIPTIEQESYIYFRQYLKISKDKN